MRNILPEDVWLANMDAHDGEIFTDFMSKFKMAQVINITWGEATEFNPHIINTILRDEKLPYCIYVFDYTDPDGVVHKDAWRFCKLDKGL